MKASQFSDYDGLLPTEMRRLKQLEDENNKPRRVVADLSLDKEMLQDVIRRKLLECVDPAGMPCAAVRHVVLPLQVSSPRTDRARTSDQGDLPDAGALWLSAGSRAAVPRGLADQPQEDLSGLSRDKLREDRKVATRPNETWAMDFVHDQLATGRKIRLLTVVDTFSRFSPAIDPRLSYRGEDDPSFPSSAPNEPTEAWKHNAQRAGECPGGTHTANSR